jgi:putative Mg2+ transporter-C (MgtC) family protein
MLAGAGHSLHAALATSFVILVNLLLRPLVRLINRQPIAQTETDFHYRVRVVCRNPEEAHVRALLLQGTAMVSSVCAASTAPTSRAADASK